MKPITTSDDPRYAKAMSHPVRARVMARLAERAASPNELSQWLGTTLGATAYHVRQLHGLGLIELVDERRVRGAVEHYYRVNPKVEIAANGSVAAGAFAAAGIAAASGGFDRPDAVLERRAARLDAKGVAAVAAELRKLLARIDRIEAEATKRLARTGGEDAVDAGVVAMAFEAVSLADQIPASRRKRSVRVKSR